MGLFRRSMPVGELVDEFAGSIISRSNGSKKSWVTDVNRLRAAVDLLDVKKVEEISSEAVAGVLSAKEGEGRSPKTINNYREILHRLCGYAIREKGVSFRETGRENPVARVPKRREAAPEITYLERPQIEGVLGGLSGEPQLRAMVAVLIFAGLRRGELVHLTRKDIDIERRLIHVRAKTVGDIKWQPKTRRNRSVPISERLFAELSRWGGAGHSTWYFPSPEGMLWDEDNFSRGLRRVQRPLGTNWGCLDFRHTFGTQLARNGVSLFKIATLMGNSPEICRRHYAFLSSEDLKEEVEFGSAEPPAIPPRPPEGPSGARAAF